MISKICDVMLYVQNGTS